MLCLMLSVGHRTGLFGAMVTGRIVLGKVEDQIVACFRGGGGVPYPGPNRHHAADPATSTRRSRP